MSLTQVPLNDVLTILKDGKDSIDLNHISENYGIRVREYPDRVVLNYDQIDSYKTRFHPITRVCRQLILNRNLDMVLHRAFDRFFNYGEDPEGDNSFDFTNMICEEKLDGSLIGLYHDGESWKYCTKSMAFAEGGMQSFESFAELIKQKIDLSPIYKNGNTDYSYIFEIVSPFDPHITTYTETRLVLLAVRNKLTGEFIDHIDEGSRIGWAEYPRQYYFSNIDDLLNMVNNLTSFEGFVCRNESGTHRIKMKSPFHIAAQHLRGEVVNEKKIIEIVTRYEDSEFLSALPHFRERFEPYIDARNLIEKKYEEKYSEVSHLENQKDFALAVKDFPFNGILFIRRKTDSSIREILENNVSIQNLVGLYRSVM